MAASKGQTDFADMFVIKLKKTPIKYAYDYMPRVEKRNYPGPEWNISKDIKKPHLNEEIEITVKPLRSNLTVQLPPLPLSTTIQEIKKMMCQQIQVDIEDQKLVWKGKAMVEGERSLGAYNVTQKGQIYLVIKKSEHLSENLKEVYTAQEDVSELEDLKATSQMTPILKNSKEFEAHLLSFLQREFHHKHDIERLKKLILSSVKQE